MKFIDYLSQNEMGDALTKREISTQLRQFFLENPMIDNNFALACSMLTRSILGYPILEEQNQELLLGWLEGDPHGQVLFGLSKADTEYISSQKAAARIHI